VHGDFYSLTIFVSADLYAHFALLKPPLEGGRALLGGDSPGDLFPGVLS
jgi:hypothetical protein